MDLHNIHAPSDLQLGVKAHEVIVAFLKRHNITYTGGCQAFYSPSEWQRRKEQYATNALLVVVYDGGAHQRAFKMSDAGDLTAELQKELATIGCFFEEATCWYGGVYRIDPAPPQ